MPQGGKVTISARNVPAGIVQPDGLGHEACIAVSISDEGPGIPDEVLPRIFDPYFTTKPGGTGLGLVTARSIVERHGGEIFAKSVPGAGTTVAFLLPARPGAPPGEAADGLTALAPVGTAEAGKESGAPGQILVLDDDAAVREALCSMLDALGFEVAVVADGLDAVELYRTSMLSGQPYSALVIDLTLKGEVGGREVMRRILEIDPGARALVCSGYSQDPVMSDPAAHGFCGVLAKPFTLTDLGREMGRVLRKSRA
jgi:CheY-like chemotaxis protein